ncbi:hypothetical protein C8F04DRAFT_1063828, partial [Mycena alexandri]
VRSCRSQWLLCFRRYLSLAILAHPGVCFVVFKGGIHACFSLRRGTRTSAPLSWILCLTACRTAYLPQDTACL